MSKKILITSTDLMMIQFLVPHVKCLSEHGYEVEIACSEVGGRMGEVRKALDGVVSAIHVVRLVRSPVSFKNILGYQDMKSVISKKYYDIIWTNEPVMGVVTRLAARKARKQGTKVMYMTHGFHFFDGAPKLNWMVYYPIERYMSSFTDLIVTINHEDFERAKTMKAKDVKYMHGIGFNPKRLRGPDHTTSIRQELNLSEKSFICVSVGELNKNKNHQVIIRALGKLHDPGITYLLCGKGGQLEKLTRLANEQGVKDQVFFLGYRSDVLDICKQADLFVFPSYREGLPISPLEAMYCGLPLVTSKTRGLVDYMVEGETGYMCNPNDADLFALRIKELKENRKLRIDMGQYCTKVVQPYLLKNAKNDLLEIIDSLHN